jgi:hypothetical protein
MSLETTVHVFMESGSPYEHMYMTFASCHCVPAGGQLYASKFHEKRKRELTGLAVAVIPQIFFRMY